MTSTVERFCEYNRCKNYKLRSATLCRVHRNMLNKTRYKYYTYFFVFNFFMVVFSTYLYVRKDSKIFDVSQMIFDNNLYQNLLLLKNDISETFGKNFTCENLDEYKDMMFNFYNSLITGFQYLEYRDWYRKN